ncbi:MAG TPA: PIN domain-containing protein [Kofleriaceae bacterium]
MSGLTFDTGALVALERDDREFMTMLKEARRMKVEIAVPAGVVAQAWRDGRRQARIARFLTAPQVEIEVLDGYRAREAGQLCGITGTRDVIDASVVLCARARNHVVVTSDPDDLRRLDPKLELIEI